MTSLFVRIFLRYLAGVLIARGFLTPEDGSFLTSDPDLAMLLETGLGFAAAAMAEGWLWLSKRLGWEKEAGK